MNNNVNMKIESFKRFFNEGIYNENDLEYLKNKEVITSKELKEIKVRPRTMRMDERTGNLQYEYELWDKTSPINGVDAEKFIKDAGLEYAEEIVLVKLGNRIVEVSDVETLRINHNINLDVDASQVAELYTMHLEDVKNTPQVNLEDINTAMTLMSDLKKEDELIEIKQLLIDIKNILTQNQEV